MLGDVLIIDLTREKVVKREVSSETVKRYLGGRGFNSKALFDMVPGRIDPLSPENVLALGNGTFAGTALPMTSRLHISTLSPLSGILGDGNAGGEFSAMLKERGYAVTVVEARESILPSILAKNLSEFLKEYLKGEGIQILTGSLVKEVEGDGRVEGIQLADGRRLNVSSVVLATGVRPNSSLLRDDGRPIEIDRVGRTAVPDVYALGDCAMSWDFITGKAVYRPLGFVVGHYARLIAEEVAGKGALDRGVIPAVYERIGRAEVYSIGLTPAEAERFGFEVNVKISEGRNWREATLTDEKGRVLGW